MDKCIGCGAVLQCDDKLLEGYTPDITKKLCERCFKIRHYNEYKYFDKSNDYYLDIINKISDTNDLVLLVCDFLNLDSINELDITNDVLLVISKRDLIPRNVDEERLLSRIKCKLNIVDKVIVCSNNNYNMDLLYEKIISFKKSNDVYVIGYTNAGKSTLINSMIKNYGAGEDYITTSVLPSTTLDMIDIKINDDLNLVDTPGLLDYGSIMMIHDKVIGKILPRKEVRPINIQVKVLQSIIVENIIRMDVKNVTSLIFYISNNLKIDRLYKENDRLADNEKFDIIVKAGNDIVIKGLGFVKTTKDCNISLYLPKGVKYMIRESII